MSYSPFRQDSANYQAPAYFHHLGQLLQIRPDLLYRDAQAGKLSLDIQFSGPDDSVIVVNGQMWRTVTRNVAARVYDLMFGVAKTQDIGRGRSLSRFDRNGVAAAERWSR